jgi:hypothetical protein
MINTLLSLALGMVPRVAAACPFVGIDCDPTSNLSIFIENTAYILVEIVSGLSVLFVVIGGAFMLMNFGNESTLEKGKKSVFFALAGFALALSSQAIISFVVVQTAGVAPVSPHLEIMRVMIDAMLFIFNGVFALMMLFYGFKLVIARGQQSELDSVKKGLVWTIGGALTINLAYALVQATVNLGF